MFDIPDYHVMKKRALGMAFYDGYKEDAFVTIVVHVTEHLTGNQFFTSQHDKSVIPVHCLFH